MFLVINTNLACFSFNHVRELGRPSGDFGGSRWIARPSNGSHLTTGRPLIHSTAFQIALKNIRNLRNKVSKFQIYNIIPPYNRFSMPSMKKYNLTFKFAFWLEPTRLNKLKILTLNKVMMTSSNGNIFSVTGPLCREFTGHRWIPLTKASDVEIWCFLCSAPG